MPFDAQRLVFNGKQLEDEELLSLMGVQEEQTLYILGRLLGGAKKRKKKTYTKPKKLKHKHKKIKLRVLKFYKVRRRRWACFFCRIALGSWERACSCMRPEPSRAEAASGRVTRR